MQIVVHIFLLATLATLTGCRTKIESHLQFVCSVDKEGVFIHSLKDNSVKKIYTTDRVFLNNHFIFINDSVLQVGHQSKLRSEERERKVYSKYLCRIGGDSVFITDNPPYSTIDKYDFLTDSILYINIKTGKNHLAKILDYEHYEQYTLKIKTREFNERGELISEKDTSFICGNTSSSSKGVYFCNFQRFYSTSETASGKTVFSKRGDLIMKNKDTQIILLKYDGYFDPKFGSGFNNPTLSSDAGKVTFQYFAGFLKSGSCIYEMDIKTKTKNKLIEGGYFLPLYSPDNKLLLLFNDNRQSKNNTWINDIYIFDIATKNKIKVGQGENYLWIPR